MNKIISLYRDAVRDDWDKQTDATLANMQEAEQNLLSRLAAGEAAVKKVAELEKEVALKEENESLRCCGNCKHYTPRGDCRSKHGYSPGHYCDFWYHDGLTKEGRE